MNALLGFYSVLQPLATALTDVVEAKVSVEPTEPQLLTEWWLRLEFQFIDSNRTLFRFQARQLPLSPPPPINFGLLKMPVAALQ